MATSPQNNRFFFPDFLLSPRSSDGSTTDSLDNINTDLNLSSSSTEYKFSARSASFWKMAVGFIAIFFLAIARFHVPNNPIPTIEDKILNALQFLNDWIHHHDNESFRSLFMFACGFQIDVIFFVTGVYWVRNAKNGRLPVSAIVFYGTRAIVQAFWWSPFPAGFYWESPGIPSFVAPYGRGSDFFFSGHSGFLVLMANEWNKIGHKKMRNYCLVNLVYTIGILLVYQVHYSIDIFTGVFFADYCFGKVDTNKEKIDRGFKMIAFNIERVVQSIKNIVLGPSVSSLNKSK